MISLYVFSDKYFISNKKTKKKLEYKCLSLFSYLECTVQCTGKKSQTLLRKYPFNLKLIPFEICSVIIINNYLKIVLAINYSINNFYARDGDLFIFLLFCF